MRARGSAFSSNGCAQVRSWSCPGVSIRLQGLPKASTSAWTLVVNPPRDLPIACAPFFFAHRRCVDERVRWWHRSSCIRCRDRWPTALKHARKPRFSPTGRTVVTPGQDHDLTCAQPLLENANPHALIGDKAYDVDFGGQSSARSADCLRAVFFRAPAL